MRKRVKTKYLTNEMQFVFRAAKLRSFRGRVVGACIMCAVYFVLLILYHNIKGLPSFKWMAKETSEDKIIKLDLEYVVVHIDLKGAPPKLNYLRSLLHMIKRRGANAVLMEYEDMFPYQKHLVNISSPNSYHPLELRQFLIDADTLNIEVIPLIQTFGHMEHVLKHSEFHHLRVDPAFPDSICPFKTESKTLIKAMLSQVILFHNDVTPLKHIHIGFDETFSVNDWSACMNFSLRREGSVSDSHMKRVVAFVKKLSKTTTVLMWDDMLRTIKPNYRLKTRKQRLDVANPVYWQYQPDVSMSHISLRFQENYHLHFNNIWVASSFKGSDGNIQTLPNIPNRFANHYNWMKLLYSTHYYTFEGYKDFLKFKGIILTGWSRYSHFNPLCELLPVSIPSLFINLNVIKRFKIGFHTNDVLENNWQKMFLKYFYEDIKTDLNCPYLDIEDNDFSQCQFDTVKPYEVVKKFSALNKKLSENLFHSEETVVPVLSYYMMRNMVDKRTLKVTVTYLKALKSQLEEVKREASYYLSRFYDKVVIDEYVGSKSHEVTQKIDDLFKSIKTVMQYRKNNISNYFVPQLNVLQNSSSTKVRPVKKILDYSIGNKTRQHEARTT